MSGYWDFVHETQEVFGFDLAQARDYYHEFKEVFTDGAPATVDDLREWGDLALDLAEDYLLAEEEGGDEGEEDEEGPEGPTGGGRGGRGEEDDDGGYDDDDPWIDEGDELEVTVDLTYEGD